ncbi:MAG: type II secretion system F family protein [Bacteriovoracaceae bacterium]|nr:type II secretion system F family protein [Bacteriovoracaceae bacterium]
MISEPKFADWCENLSQSLDSGLDINSHLESRGSIYKNTKYDRKVLANINTGERLYQAIGYPKSNNATFYQSIIKTGEIAGQLTEVLADLSEYIRFNVKIRKEIYRLILMFFLKIIALAAYLGGAMMMLEVVSRKKIDLLGLGLYGDAGATKLFLTACGGSVALALIGYICFKAINLKPVESLYLKLPLLGRCLRAFAMFRFTYAMKLVFNTEMGLRESVELIYGAAGSKVIKGKYNKTIEALDESKSFAVSLSTNSYIPENLIKSIEFAERAGKIPDASARLSVQFKEEAEKAFYKLKDFVNLMTKILIFLVCVGSVASLMWHVAVKPMIEAFKNF